MSTFTETKSENVGESTSEHSSHHEILVDEKQPAQLHVRTYRRLQALRDHCVDAWLQPIAQKAVPAAKQRYVITTIVVLLLLGLLVAALNAQEPVEAAADAKQDVKHWKETVESHLASIEQKMSELRPQNLSAKHLAVQDYKAALTAMLKPAEWLLRHRGQLERDFTQYHDALLRSAESYKKTAKQYREFGKSETSEGEFYGHYEQTAKQAEVFSAVMLAEAKLLETRQQQSQDMLLFVEKAVLFIERTTLFLDAMPASIDSARRIDHFLKELDSFIESFRMVVESFTAFSEQAAESASKPTSTTTEASTTE